MEMKEVPNEENIAIKAVNYGGFWKRVISYIIDFFVLIVPIALMQHFLGGSTTENPITIADYIINISVWGVYYVYCETSPWQATVGKKIVGLKVTDLSGNKVTTGQAITRYLMMIPACLLLFIGILMVAFTEKKQGLHDKVARALVVVA